MPSAEYDVRYMAAGVEVLDKYLMSVDIYWPVGVTPPAGEPPYPQLTLGGLSLARARLLGRRLSPDHRARFDLLNRVYEATRNRWRVAWEGKAAREFHARLSLWRDFLEDYRAKPENNYDRYAYEVTRRVMLGLLGPDAVGVSQAEKDLLKTLDKQLRSVFLPGEFIWGSELASGFARETYWYLYGELRR